MRSLRVAGAIVFLLAACSRPAPPPSILLVSIDSLRADHLGAYGYERATSPFLDSLAAEGVRFADFQSLSPWTLPSHTTMLSGLHELRHGVVEMDRAIAPDTRLLAEELREHGYRTAGFVTGFFVSHKFGFARGFDRFHDFDVRQGEDMQGLKPLGGEAIDLALEWIGRDRSKPVFVFLHLFDVHWPYDPPADYRNRFRPPPDGDPGAYRGYAYYREHPLSVRQREHVVARYDASIRYVDDQLARLHRELENRGFEFVTLVTADHGEEFFEHGSWGHAHTLYREQVEIPLIVHGPGVPRGRVVDAPADMTNLAPTVRELAGLPPSPIHEGLSRVPSWRGEEAPAERARISTTSRFDTLLLGWRRGRDALIVDLRAGRRSLYDETADRRDAEDLAARSGDRVATLERLLRDAVAERLPTTPRLEWRGLAPSTLHLDTTGAFVWLDGAALPDGFPPSLALPLQPAGRLGLRMVPNDARLRVHVEGGSPALSSAAGEALAPGENGIDLDALGAAAPQSAPPDGAIRLSVERNAAPTGAVTISDAQREALRSLGYVNE